MNSAARIKSSPLSLTPVQCPSCGKRGLWFTKDDGPFCSRRCKLIDLGKWLGEEHVISEPLGPELPSAESLTPQADAHSPDPVRLGQPQS
jgi:endogenous inhibitor of DNA gyrase (YacG/DUF329 family)